MQQIILMKVARTLTSKLLIYYSLKGNTKGMIDNFDFTSWDTIDLRKTIDIELNKYETILIATSTYGRGAPPPPFFKIKERLLSLNNKRIGLFGSGRSEYEYFCGALDVLEEILSPTNKIIFKFKFEGFPRKKDICNFKRLMEVRV